ncbi:aminopeptidase P family protein [Rhizobium laguerreae]|uniref:M24 family metallopeptidase n=1 Tax=Rhizobium laguerreae TaxID=1076926 RepID=UPI001C91541C|nr:Xaa-Pro peptidase family protein [Rhizobium laguerreae]MBY3393864.1 aminopeptidase P family protein [Rhizobium laguerreae]MBY3471726.1 aminopeptidase P family protein [Rhizobium laguerreae]MBY3493480.1 aminopeptidase P family protein [Rhizobium laguerreae]MBY3500306.1 aminopeptidase P family protein [Rhizobium laguerreae]MBY3519869.1 aminopeptidase P family protein [Rhizobium laguerreae]
MLREERDSAEPTGSTIFKDARKQAYLNPEGADRPLISPVPATTLDRVRRYRLERLRGKMHEWDCGALLLYDPVNIRYAFDSSNMSIWTMHNASRYALILADGPAILFEFEGAEHVNDGLPGIDEIRPAKSWIFFTSGNLTEPRLKPWADEVADLVSRNGGNKRVAVDRLEPAGAFELRERGFKLLDGQELAERARSIKSADEIELMRWTIRVCEAGMARMYEVSEPGRTEREIWAELHFENARSGGEWLETKLLTAGPRTNPWYQECSDYVIKRGEMISFDTDMIGPYGYCADLSRSWTAGHVAMSAKQKELYAAARDQIEHNLAVLKPGMTFEEFNALSWRIPEKYQPYRYTLALHGTGMVDEWPGILLHPDFDPDFSGIIEGNMVLNVESLIAEAGSESIKLETQALITARGAERLDTFPWEEI